MESFSATLPKDYSRLRPLRAQLDDWLVALGVVEEDRAAVVLATHEVAANAMLYQRAGNVEIFGRIDGDRIVVISIKNEGPWISNPLSDERGRGLPLVHRLMSGVQIDTGPDLTTLRMRKHLRELL